MAADDPAELTRTRRGADPLAFRIFGLLRRLPEEDRRLVLAALDGAKVHGSASPERVTAARVAVDRFLADGGGALSKRRYERWRQDHGERDSIPSATFVANTFGSWAAAMDALGHEPTPDHLGFRLRMLGPRPSDEQVIADLRRCGDELGVRQLAFCRYRAWARARERSGRRANTLLVSPSSFIKRFGSFPQALRLAGLEPTNRGPRCLSSQNTPERLIECLRRAAADRDVPRITLNAYQGWRAERLAAGEDLPSGWTIRERLGGWPEALAAAGLTAVDEVTAGYGRGRGRKTSVEHLARSLLAAARARGMPLSIGSYELWRADRMADIQSSRPPSANTICRRLHKWSLGHALLETALGQEAPVASLADSIRSQERSGGR